MIRRGARVSRILALLIVLGPTALGLAAFGAWAVKRWSVDSARIAQAAEQRHRAEASADQAMLYAPLGEAWEEYAATEISGLAQQPTRAAAVSATRARLRELYERFDGAALTAVPLASEVENGLERMRFETRGDLPEAALSGFLTALEAEAPFLFVDHLDIRRREGGGERLALRLEISAYRLEEARE